MVNHEREQELQIPPNSTQLNSSDKNYDFYVHWVKSGKEYTVTTYRREKKTGKVDISTVQRGVSEQNLTKMLGSLIS